MLVIGEKKGKERKVSNKDIQINIGVFFDGTANNKLNVLEYNRLPWFGKDLVTCIRYCLPSYKSEFSNIAKLSDVYTVKKQLKEYTCAIYIEGVSTAPRDMYEIDGGFDSLFSAATGMGLLGINGKIDRACRELCSIIRQIIKKIETNDINVDLVKIDVFGFSRGAASARRFINCLESVKGDDSAFHCLSLRDLLNKQTIQVKKIKSSFMGLFDTVSSYGIKPSDFLNNVEKLALKVSKPQKVVHFVAADEYRKYFALTNINSAPNGSLELIFPGSHSDIGGSYPSSCIETFRGCGKDRAELLEEGWINSVTETHRQVSNGYSMLFFLLMVKYSNEFRPEMMSTDSINYYVLPPELEAVKHLIFNVEKQQLYKIVTENGIQIIKEIIRKDNDEIKGLRYHYIHLSATNLPGMYPNTNNKRIIINA